MVRSAQRWVHRRLSVATRRYFERGTRFGTATAMLCAFFAVVLVVDYLGPQRYAFTDHSIEILFLASVLFAIWSHRAGDALPKYMGLLLVVIHGVVIALAAAQATEITQIAIDLKCAPLIAIYVVWFCRPKVARLTMLAYSTLVITVGLTGPGGARLESSADYGEILLLVLFTGMCVELGILWHKGVRSDHQVDHLTRAINREGMYRHLEREIAHARRFSEPLSIIMIDVDSFKEVNDRDGHHAGDELLASLVQELRGALRDTDTISRLGGDEFILLLPHTDAAAAQSIVERLQTVGPHPWSGGVAQLADGDDVDSLLLRADRSMYQSKQQRKVSIDSADD